MNNFNLLIEQEVETKNRVWRTKSNVDSINSTLLTILYRLTGDNKYSQGEGGEAVTGELRKTPSGFFEEATNAMRDTNIAIGSTEETLMATSDLVKTLFTMVDNDPRPMESVQMTGSINCNVTAKAQ